MRLNEISDNLGATRPRKRVGRGIASGTGKTSGKGMKGQKSRSGVSLLGFEGGQMPIYRRLPKRGFKNPFSKDFAELNVGLLQEAIDAKRIDGSKTLTTAMLVEAGVAKKRKDGVRLLGHGELKAKVTLEIESATKGAIAAVEKAGGTVAVSAPTVAKDEASETKGIRGKNKRRAQDKAAAGESAE
ncbi:50S ribosomal protein L15 [Alphaproteobacteria bacterium LMO-S08]|jgi:large subunit ribosomal protein L15|nr:50S ribosomal protein L15 [Alphaproteobacteria bacterium LMO-S08]